MSVKPITSQTEYESFLAAHGGSFLQSWSWGEFQKTQDHQILRFAVEENNSIKLVAQFIEQTIPYLNGKYLYCAYGPVGDMSLLSQLITELKKQFPEYWFIRLEPQTEIPILGQHTLRIQPGKTLVTNLAQTESELQAKMHQKTRYNIKVALKHEVEIVLTNSDSEISMAIDLIASTSKRQQFSDHPKAYYDKLSTSTNVQPKIYTAHRQGQLLASAIMIDCDNTRTYLFGGSSDEHKNVMAPYLLHWRAMLDAKANGLARYDWWGIETASGETPGFVKFKLRWGGEELSYPKPQDIIAKPLNYLVYKLARRLGRKI